MKKLCQLYVCALATVCWLGQASASPPADPKIDEVVSKDVAAYNHRFNLGVSYSVMGQHDLAIQEFDEAIRLKPDDAAGYHGAAWILATAPSTWPHDRSRAVTLAREAVRLENDANNIHTLAAAFARAGQLEKAVSTQERAIAMLRANGGSDEMAAEMKSHLNLYRHGQPYSQETK